MAGDVRHREAREPGCRRQKARIREAHAERRLEVARHPREQHVEQPVAAEVVDDDRPHGWGSQDPAPWNRRAFGRHWLGFDAATVANSDCPYRYPHEPNDAKDVERQGPAVLAGEPAGE